MTSHPDGSRITIHFEGKLSDGEIFESTFASDPMSVCLGNHEILEKLESTIRTMDKDETRTIEVSPEEGFGEYRDDRILTIAKEAMPPIGPMKPGQEILVRTPDGQELPGIVLDMSNDIITIDANHPLAGEELQYTITVVDIRPPDEGQSDSHPSSSAS